MTITQPISWTVSATVPSTPAAPTTTTTVPNVVINWVAPANGGSAITGYDVEIRHSDGTTFTTYAGCSGTAVSCTVPISVLKAAPYNCVAGSSVFARVKATNSIGSSAYSLAGNGALLIAPSAPDAPITAI